VSRFNPEDLCLVVGLASSVLMRRGRRSAAYAVLGSVPAGAAAPSEGFESAIINLLQEHGTAGASLECKIGDAIARYFVVVPPNNAHRSADLRLVAELRFETLFGDRAADWLVNAQWSATRPFLAGAVPRSLLASLSSAARSCRFGSPLLQGEFVHAWNRHCRSFVDPQGWVLHAGSEASLLVACAGGRVQAITRVDLVDPRSAQTLESAIQRWAIRWNVEAPKTLYLLGQSLWVLGGQQSGGTALKLVDDPAEKLARPWFSLSSWRRGEQARGHG
jgi:hypothetical protein